MLEACFGSLEIFYIFDAFDINITDIALLRSLPQTVLSLQLDLSIVQSIHGKHLYLPKGFFFPTPMSSLDEVFPHSGCGVQDRITSLGSMLGKITLFFLPDRMPR